MKLIKHVFVALILAASSPLIAQVPLNTPAESQLSNISQRIDFTDITVTYSSPGAKGRKVFGEVVKFGQIWRAGANDNTVIRFSSDVKVNGTLVKAGSYGVHVLPTETEWTFIFSSKTNDWGSYNYSPSFDVLRFTVPVEAAPFTEWMQFNFTGRSPGKARLELQWGESKAGFDILVANDLIIANFTEQLRNRQGFGYLAWMQAANYLLSKNFNLEQAVAWADSSIKRERRFDNLYLKSRIYGKMDKSSAREIFRDEAAIVAKEADFMRLVDDAIKEGDKKKALTFGLQGVKAFDASWMTQTALGKAHLENGDKKNAKKAFDTALKTVPENRKKMIQDLLAKAV